MSQVALPEMKKYNYADSLATGSVAAGGIIGILIPPSVVLVLYGILTETSIGDLFIAGMVPGILTVLGFMLAISIITKIWPHLGAGGEPKSFSEKMSALGKTWAILVLFLLVIGGIYLGVFTPTEAAGVGATFAFVISAIRRRLSMKKAKGALLETVQTSAMLFAILIGSADPEQYDGIFRYCGGIKRICRRAGYVTNVDHGNYSADVSGNGRIFWMRWR